MPKNLARNLPAWYLIKGTGTATPKAGDSDITPFKFFGENSAAQYKAKSPPILWPDYMSESLDSQDLIPI